MKDIHVIGWQCWKTTTTINWLVGARVGKSGSCLFEIQVTNSFVNYYPHKHFLLLRTYRVYKIVKTFLKSYSCQSINGQNSFKTMPLVTGTCLSNNMLKYSMAIQILTTNSKKLNKKFSLFEARTNGRNENLWNFKEMATSPVLVPNIMRDSNTVTCS